MTAAKMITAKTRVDTKSLESAQQLWHSMDASAVLRALGVDREGFDEQSAQARLEKFGPNVLPRKPPPSLAQIHHFRVLIGVGPQTAPEEPC